MCHDLGYVGPVLARFFAASRDPAGSRQVSGRIYIIIIIIIMDRASLGAQPNIVQTLDFFYLCP